MVNSKVIQVSDKAKDFTTVVKNWWTAFIKPDSQDWEKICINGTIRATDKASFVYITMVNPGDVKEDGSCEYISIYNFQFWCPEKFIKSIYNKHGFMAYSVPKWFLKEKIEEFINQPLF